MSYLYVPAHRLTTLGMVSVKQKDGQVAYLITGQWGKLNDVLDVYLVSGQRCAQIKQKSLGLFPKFALYDASKHQIGTLRRYYGLGRDMLFVKGLNWLIVGNVLSFNYKVYQGKTLIMTIGKTKDSRGEVIEFFINDDNNAAYCLCVAAILNYWAKRWHPNPSFWERFFARKNICLSDSEGI